MELWKCPLSILKRDNIREQGILEVIAGPNLKTLVIAMLNWVKSPQNIKSWTESTGSLSLQMHGRELCRVHFFVEKEEIMHCLSTGGAITCMFWSMKCPSHSNTWTNVKLYLSSWMLLLFKFLTDSLKTNASVPIVHCLNTTDALTSGDSTLIHCLHCLALRPKSLNPGSTWHCILNSPLQQSHQV